MAEYFRSTHMSAYLDDNQKEIADRLLSFIGKSYPYYDENNEVKYYTIKVVINGSSTGFGKTRTTLYMADELKKKYGQKTIMVIGPKNSEMTWERESSLLHLPIEFNADMNKSETDMTFAKRGRSYTKSRRSSVEDIQSSYVTFITYPTLHGTEKTIKHSLLTQREVNGKTEYFPTETLIKLIDDGIILVIDEAHNAKNITSKTTRAILAILKEINRSDNSIAIELSGTVYNMIDNSITYLKHVGILNPDINYTDKRNVNRVLSIASNIERAYSSDQLEMKNRSQTNLTLEEIINQLNIYRGEELKDPNAYAAELYYKLYNNIFKWVFYDGIVVTFKQNQYTGYFDILYQEDIDIINAAIEQYESTEQSFIASNLKQIESGYINTMCDFMLNYLNDYREHRGVLSFNYDNYNQAYELCKEIMKEHNLGKVRLISGDTTDRDRVKYIKEFMNYTLENEGHPTTVGKVRLLIVQMSTMSESIDLHGTIPDSNILFLVSPLANIPQTFIQFFGRGARRGQITISTVILFNGKGVKISRRFMELFNEKFEILSLVQDSGREEGKVIISGDESIPGNPGQAISGKLRTPEEFLIYIRNGIEPGVDGYISPADIGNMESFYQMLENNDPRLSNLLHPQPY